MSGRVKITVNGEAKYFPKDDQTYQMLDGMEHEGVQFHVEDEPSTPKVTQAWQPPADTQMSSLEGVEAQLGSKQQVPDTQPSPAPAPQQPKPDYLEPVTTGQKVHQYTAQLLDGVTGGNWARLSGLLKGPEARARVAQELGSMQQNHPTAAAVTDAVGAGASQLGIGKVLGALPGVARLGSLIPTAASTVYGGVNGASRAVPGQELQGGLIGAGTGALSGLLGQGAGAVGNAMAGRGTQRVADAAAARVSPGAAQQYAKPVVDSLSKGISGWAPWAGAAAGGAAGAATGGPLGGAAGTALGAGAGKLLGEGIADAFKPALQSIAPKIAPALGTVGGRLGQAAGLAAQGAGQALAPLTAAVTGSMVAGNDKPARVKQALTSAPQVLGPYQMDLAAVADDPGRLAATITQLEQTDAEFRTKILPALSHL